MNAITLLPQLERALFAEPVNDIKSGHSDLDMQARPPHLLVQAAVLIPIINRATGPTILLTRRTASLRHHAGQISFPGGRVDATDRDAVHTALREAQEEIGLPPDSVKVCGFLAPYVTGTGYCVTPIVGWIDKLAPLTPSLKEVDHVFEMPLSYIMDPLNRQTRSAMWYGRLRTFYVYDFKHKYIWGATAGMLAMFADRLMGTKIS